MGLLSHDRSRVPRFDSPAVGRGNRGSSDGARARRPTGRGARWMDDARGGRQSERVIVDGAREMRGRVDRE